MAHTQHGRRKDKSEILFQRTSDRDIITANRRAALMTLALDEPEKFVRMCVLCRVVSLDEMCWWPRFADDYPDEAEQITHLAESAGIQTRVYRPRQESL